MHQTLRSCNMQLIPAVVQITSTYFARLGVGVVNTSQNIALRPCSPHCIVPELARSVESYIGGKTALASSKRGSAPRSPTNLVNLDYRAAFAYIRFHAIRQLRGNRNHVLSRAE